MAISATFQADFTQFVGEVNRADVKLRSFEDNSHKVGTALTRMTDGFSGTKIIQDATLMVSAVERIGGVSKLTEAELKRVSATASEAAAKMKAMGIEVPPGIANIASHANTASGAFGNMKSIVGTLAGAFGIAFSIGAVVQFGRSVFNAASEIHDMSLKLGISAEAVQGFKFAAEQTGSTIDAVGIAITRMNVNLSEGSKGTVAALTAAGLQFAAIRAMKPEDSFLAITDAVAKIPDPMLRSEVALQLFGRSAAELLPAIMEGFRKTADAASKMSNETIARLEKAQDAWGQLSTKVTIVTGEMIASSLEFFEWYGRVADAWSTGVAMAAKKAVGDIELLPPVLAKTAEQLKAEEKAATDATKATNDLAEAAAKLEAAWTKANATAIAKMESDSRNAEGMVRMNDAIATQERALQNAEGEWLLYRDAAMMATAAIDAELQKEIAAVEDLTTALQGLTIIGEKAKSSLYPEKPSGVTVFGGGGPGISGADLSLYGASLKTAFHPGLRTSDVMSPFGANGSVINNVTVNAQGGFYDNPESVQKLARTVGDALTAGWRSQGRQVT